MAEREYRVHLQTSDMRDPLAQSVPFWVIRTHDKAILDPIGVWEKSVEGGPVPTPSFIVPREAMEALVEALDAWRGQPSHAKTEAAVLREWLAVERGRVDKVLDLDNAIAAIGPPVFKEKR